MVGSTARTTSSTLTRRPPASSSTRPESRRRPFLSAFSKATMFASFVSQLLDRRGIHYSWVIAAVTFFAMLTTSAALGLPGAMLQPLSREFGWSTDQLSSVFAVRFALFGLL